MKTPARGERPFTGRHMLVIMLAFFGVVTAVNVTMATLANLSWTGLIVRNSYVASREFNALAEAGRAREALGWTGTLSIGGGVLRYELADPDRRPVLLEDAVVNFRRPSHEGEDRTAEATPAGDGVIVAPAEVADGLWIVEIVAEAGTERPWRDARRIVLREGILQ